MCGTNSGQLRGFVASRAVAGPLMRSYRSLLTPLAYIPVGNIRDGMIGEGNGFAVGPWWIASRLFRFIRSWFPQAQVFKNILDDGRLINDDDEAHRMAAFGTFKRVDLVDFLDEPGPVGF